MDLAPHRIIAFAVLIAFLVACDRKQVLNSSHQEAILPLQGTWELIKSTTIQGEDTTIIDYAKDLRFIKVINKTHFTFLNHDLNQGLDSTATFVAGGGKYQLDGNKYKEHLEFCNYREWEGHNFEFTVEIKNDTLIQQGIEKIEELGIDRVIIEVYKRTVE